MGIFDDPPKRGKAIAKRYVSFDDFFIKKIDEIQASVKRLEGMRGIYSVVADILEGFEGNHEIKLDCHDTMIKAAMRGLPGDSLDVPFGLAQAIGARLKRDFKHRGGSPSISAYGSTNQLDMYWYLRRDEKILACVNLEYSAAGSAFGGCRFDRREMATTTVSYTLMDPSAPGLSESEILQEWSRKFWPEPKEE